MSFFKKFWRVPALALVVALPLFAACADDEGAGIGQVGDGIGSISGTVTNSATGEPIAGALVGTNPATTTALTDVNGDYQIDNVPIPTNPTTYAVTAAADGFQAKSETASLTTSAPTDVVDIALDPGEGVTEGDLNVLVVRRTGEAVEGATVTVSDPTGAPVATMTTNDAGFALFDNLPVGSFTVTATASISGIDFFASGGTNVRGGETSFLQLTLGRDFDQSVFPNIDGEPVELTDAADIRFVPVPGQPDDDPLVDCNIIRTQHMFIAEVVDDGLATSPNLVSGVKVQWDLNISTQGICEIFLNEINIFRCEELLPGTTGSIVDSDDPDLDPNTARSGLNPAFNVTQNKAVTFTNDNDQVIAFNNQNVTVGAGQTWIIITSPVEGVSDVIAATPDIPASDPDCANDGPDQCDKEFAVKRWVNWATAVAELEWDGQAGDPNLATDPPAVFTFLEDGQTVSNVLARSEEVCTEIILLGLQPSQVPGECELEGNRFLIYAEVDRLRADSPFTLNVGVIEAEILDDSPALEIFGEDPLNDGPGALDGIQNVANRGLGIDDDCDLNAAGNGFLQCDDQYQVELGTGLGSPTVDTTDPAFRDLAQGEFFAPHNFGTDAPGWVVFEMRLDPTIFFCVDVDLNNTCDPGNVGSPDSFSTAYQQLLNEGTDNTNTIAIRFLDEFGEICDDFTFDKEFVASRLRIIKTTPDATVQTVDELDGGPDVEPFDTPRPVKTHTVQIGQSFTYTITVINDGEVASQNVRITDTLPRFGVQFDDDGSDDGEPTRREGHQAFAFVTDRPTFDPVAVVYAIDTDNDDPGDDVDFCVRGDDGSATGNAYVEPPQCAAPDGSTPGAVLDAGTVPSARSEAEGFSSDGDQVVWIQWFDLEIRENIGGTIEGEDTVEVELIADEDLVDVDPTDPLINGYPALPGTWCDIATVTDGPGNLDNTATESLDADTLCHEVREALLEVVKTTEDAVVTAGAMATFRVEIANNGSAPLTNVVIVDTLDAAFFPLPEGGVFTVTVDSAFGGAVLTPDSRIFEVPIGTLDPTDGFVLAYTVEITTPLVEGLFCNRVTASGDTPVGTISDSDIACVTTTVTIELDISNEDGEITGTAFSSAKEQFNVGESGDAFVYEVIITNQSAFAATGVTVVDQVAPNTGAIVCEGIRATDPAGGANPSTGTVVGGDCSDSGFTWDIGTLDAGEAAFLYFTAEALAAQNDVGNRVRLTADQLAGEIVDEEPTTVTGG